MKHMVDIQVIDVLAGDDVDLLIPVPVKRTEVGKLLMLFISKVWEIGGDDGCVLHGIV